MNYDEALKYIHSVGKFGMRLGLESIGNLLDRLGNPQNDLRFIHLAGTNGKGSTAKYISTVLSDCGYKTGLYTSPYLERFNERISIDGIDISDNDLAYCVEIVKNACDEIKECGEQSPTEFEIVTASAFLYYKMKKVDIVVLEVGLGGRYDATNIIKSPLVSVICSIGMDHIDILGDTIEKIAYEKAGIIKEKTDVIVYDQEKEVIDVIKRVAREKNVSVIKSNFKYKNRRETIDGQVFDFCDYTVESYEKARISMIGEHQIKNAILAVNTLVYLRNNKEFENITKEKILSGIKNAFWKGRLEVVSKKPFVILDGAHNFDGAYTLSKTIDELFDDSWEKILVFGVLKDKEADKIIKLLVPHFDKMVVTVPDNPRAMDIVEVAIKSNMYLKETYKIDNITCIESCEEAYEQALRWYRDMENKPLKISKKGKNNNKTSKVSKSEIAKRKKQLIVCAGSLYLIGRLRSYILEK